MIAPAKSWEQTRGVSPVNSFRKRRSALVMELIDRVYRERGECRILDIGGEPAYWDNFDRDELVARRVHITLLNLRPRNMTIDPLFTVAAGNGCALAYEDNSFDLAHSNSVIEHVGGWREMRQFAAEVARVAPRHFVQTPYFWFPVEPHYRAPFFHWLPEQVRARVMMRTSLASFQRAGCMCEAMEAVTDARLLDAAQMQALFPSSRIEREKVCGLTKSLMAVA